MTEAEKKALALLNEFSYYEVPDLGEAQYRTAIQALCRAIEQHDAFRQEVSDALREWGVVEGGIELSRFIIAKPDPLVEAIQAADEAHPGWESASDYAQHLRAALAARGLEIVEVGHG